MNKTFNELRERIEKRTAKLGVIGLGYVGLPMSIQFARAGFEVTGIDTNEDRVRQLQNNRSYILDISDQTLNSVSGKFHASANFDPISETDAIIICVPTPLRKTKDPDLSYILSATKEIAKRLHRGQLIILESTTYPGTTGEVILPELQTTDLVVGTDFFLAFSPERIDPGNKNYTIQNTPKIVGGVTSHCGELAELLYRTIVETVVRVSSAKAAEMVKLLENTFRAINIGMVNEVAIICDKLGIDTWEVIDAAATKPFGFMPFYPGPGLGGHCIPVDPHYLSWKLKTLNYSARFIELAGEINGNMPQYVVGKINDALNLDQKSVKGTSILLLGTAYKKNSNDMRESPALDIFKLLKEKGARIHYNDPYIPVMELDSETFRSEALNPKLLADSDCVVIVTNHDSYDWQFVVDHSKLVVDTRNATRNTTPGKCRIVKL
ncbi:MAG: UDP-N-acetyl-D-glucosamine dehydrogenase [Acidobacteria bacterium]|nr:MAG: UDP-N-acetyl-D-glucosamine dehydrogenase [Acidobacteriota bacterium]